MSRTVFSYALEEQFHFCKHARSTESLNIDCKLVISIMILLDICGKHLVIGLTSHVGQLIELGVTHFLYYSWGLLMLLPPVISVWFSCDEMLTRGISCIYIVTI